MGMKPVDSISTRRPDLGQAAYEVMLEAPTMGFVGQQIMPYFWVSKQEASYPVIPKEALFSLLATARASDGAYNRFGEKFERGYYTTEENGLETPLDDRDVALYGDEFAYELAMTRILMNNILRKEEYDVKNQLFNTSNFSAHNATTSWATTASSDPQYDIETGRDSIRYYGIMPNALVVPWDGYKYLKMSDNVLDWVYKQEPEAAKTGKITNAHLMDYLDLQYLIVAGSLYNSAKRNQTASLSDIWGSQYCLLCRIAQPGDPITEPCIGRIIAWNEGVSGQQVISERYRDETVRADILRVRHDTKPTLLKSINSSGTAVSEISKAAGYLIDFTAAS
jgi:hypothetical protein